MPVTFDFSLAAPGGANFPTTASLNFSLANVNFTLSPQSAGNASIVDIGGANASENHLSIFNSVASTQAYTLRWSSTGGNDALQGPVTVDIDEYFGPNPQLLTTMNGVFAAPDNSATATPGLVNGIRFSLSATASGEILTVSADNLACFCAGTRLATPDGDTPIEDLRPGDLLQLADGGLTRVLWLGQQEVSVLRSDPRRVNPIRIAAGTLGNARDLLLSPDHAVAIDGVLINAAALINGTTIDQVAHMPHAGFTYYHVETEGHEVILAEGVPCESYLDNPGREVFDNGAERADAPRIQEMDMPRVASNRLVPEAIRRRLALPMEQLELLPPAGAARRVNPPLTPAM